MKSAAWLFWLYNTFSVFLPRSVPPVPHDASDGADAPNRIEPASQAHPATVDMLSFERICQENRQAVGFGLPDA